MYAWEHPLYREDVRQVAGLSLPWEQLTGCTVLLTGASGMIGSFLADVLMERNVAYGQGIRVVAMGRNAARGAVRFAAYRGDAAFTFVAHDINTPIRADEVGTPDYLVHLASNTHPVAYATEPISTITTNIIGTGNVLSLACEAGATRVAFCSSNEVYGENRGDVELFREDYCGYIDPNTLRAGYPESKRCGEALCQAYRKEKGLDVVIPRLTRTYGPTLLKSDTKALSQFLNKGLAGEDIVLKSAGTQYYSYLYVADSVAGLLTVLLQGGSGEAYNIADEASDIRLKDLAALIAGHAGTRVVFDLPDAVEAAGFSRATKARLDGAKLRALGFAPRYAIAEGIARTMEMLRETERV